MDSKNYTDLLGQLDKQEIEVELNNFYTFNSGLLQFFKAIEEQFQSLLNSSNLNTKSIEIILIQTNQLLPELNNLKFEISMLEEEKLCDSLKNNIYKTIKYVKEVMVISEISLTKQRFLKLLEDNELKFKAEQDELDRIEKEKKRVEAEQKEKVRQEHISRDAEEKEKLRLEEERRQNEVRIKELERQELLRKEEERKANKKIEQMLIDVEVKERLKLEEERKKREEEIKNDKKLKEKEEKIKKEERDNRIEEFEEKFNIKRNTVFFQKKSISTVIIKNQEWMSFDYEKGLIIKDDNTADELESYYDGWKVPNIDDWKQLRANSEKCWELLFSQKYFCFSPYHKYFTSNIVRVKNKSNYSWLSGASKEMRKDFITYQVSQVCLSNYYGNFSIDTERREANIRLMRNI